MEPLPQSSSQITPCMPDRHPLKCRYTSLYAAFPAFDHRGQGMCRCANSDTQRLQNKPEIILRKGERERKREGEREKIPVYRVLLKMPLKIGVTLGRRQNWKLQTPSRSPTWVGVAQGLELPPDASQDLPLQKAGAGNQTQHHSRSDVFTTRLGTGTPLFAILFS